MSNYAIISEGKVVNTAYFEGDDEGFDYTQQWGSDAYGVLMEDGVRIEIGYSYADGVFTAPPEPEPTKEQLMAQADQQRQVLIFNANQVFVSWQTKLLLNRATDDEKKSLNEWLDYFDALQSLDLTQAPNIEWPVQPAIPEAGQ